MNLPTVYQQFIYKSRYARWNEELGRREEWPETVARYFNFFEGHLKQRFDYVVPIDERHRLEQAVLSLKVMPSMRALMTAGPALEREHMAGYNCAFIPIDDPKAFDEFLYVLMNGTGCGFSVEASNIHKLPVIPDKIHTSDSVIVVADSKIGWASSLRELIALLYAGKEPQINLSKIRPAGARLKTFGGRASGPEPLAELFRFTIDIFKRAHGRRLNSLECHDICCKIGEIVVVGGVRRSAEISLSDLSDNDMRAAKFGQWWVDNPQRALANNSAVYNERPSIGTFISEWEALYNSKSGERGIFNRAAALRQIEYVGKREGNQALGTNPCLEALLNPFQTCNLSEAIIRQDETKESFMDKVEIATILGTWQSTLDDFGYVRKKWSNIEIDERLMGVSLSGILDSEYLSRSTDILIAGRYLATNINAREADKLRINPSAGITLNKPSGTVSQLVDCASGVHPRYAPYYIRTIRGDKKDPLTQFLIEHGIPHEDCVLNPKNTTVFSFPQKAPEGVITRDNISAIEHMEFYKHLKNNWCEHTASITINVKEEEWLDVGAWVYKNMDDIIGLSFLPATEHSYRQAPYQECTEQDYINAMKTMPENINWDNLNQFEKEDNTVASQEFACVSGMCEIA